MRQLPVPVATRHDHRRQPPRARPHVPQAVRQRHVRVHHDQHRAVALDHRLLHRPSERAKASHAAPLVRIIWIVRPPLIGVYSPPGGPPDTVFVIFFDSPLFAPGRPGHQDRVDRDAVPPREEREQRGGSRGVPVADGDEGDALVRRRVRRREVRSNGGVDREALGELLRVGEEPQAHELRGAREAKALVDVPGERRAGVRRRRARAPGVERRATRLTGRSRSRVGVFVFIVFAKFARRRRVSVVAAGLVAVREDVGLCGEAVARRVEMAFSAPGGDEDAGLRGRRRGVRPPGSLRAAHRLPQDAAERLQGDLGRRRRGGGGRGWGPGARRRVEVGDEEGVQRAHLDEVPRGRGAEAHALHPRLHVARQRDVAAVGTGGVREGGGRARGRRRLVREPLRTNLHERDPRRGGGGRGGGGRDGGVHRARPNRAGCARECAARSEARRRSAYVLRRRACC